MNESKEKKKLQLCYEYNTNESESSKPIWCNKTFHPILHLTIKIYTEYAMKCNVLSTEVNPDRIKNMFLLVLEKAFTLCEAFLHWSYILFVLS